MVSITAHADIFSFNAEGSAGGFNGSGTLTATANDDGSYTIIGITGPGVTGLIAKGQFELNDNQLLPDATGLLDIDGLSFTDVMGNTGYNVNIFYDASVSAYSTILEDTDGDGDTFPTTFDVSAVTPEPPSVALFGTGLLGVLGLVKRRLA